MCNHDASLVGLFSWNPLHLIASGPPTSVCGNSAAGMSEGSTEGSPDTRSVMQVSFREMFQTGVLFIPSHAQDRILKLYGGWTLQDFDTLLGLNEKMGEPEQNCLSSMRLYLNQVQGDVASVRDQWLKLSNDPVLSDAFNVTQSIVRYVAGEKVWCV